MVAAFEIGALSSVLEKLKRRPTSVVVITFALHAKGREFEPHVDHFFGFLCVFSCYTPILTLFLLITMHFYPQYFDGNLLRDS